jgi:hypothetical protein
VEVWLSGVEVKCSCLRSGRAAGEVFMIAGFDAKAVRVEVKGRLTRGKSFPFIS